MLQGQVDVPSSSPIPLPFVLLQLSQKFRAYPSWGEVCSLVEHQGRQWADDNRYRGPRGSLNGNASSRGWDLR